MTKEEILKHLESGGYLLNTYDKEIIYLADNDDLSNLKGEQVVYDFNDICNWEKHTKTKIKESELNDITEVFDYLVELRDSGVTNMFGAVPYMVMHFDNMSEEEASKYLTDWMESFKR